MRRLVLFLSVGALLAAAPAAQAIYEPLGSGATKLTLDQSFLALLKQNNVKLNAIAPAKLKGNTVSFPVTAGKFDPTNQKGTVEHEGALLFKAGKRSIPIKALQLKTTQKRSPLSAKVGGSQLKLASAKSLSVKRAGFANQVKVTKLTLSAKLATRLAKKLDLRGAIKAGAPLGQTKTQANPKTLALLPKGRSSLTLDPAFEAKLKSLFVAVNPIFPAEHPGPFTFPTAGGTLSPDASEGTLQSEGALELLQLGGGQLFWREPALDFQSKSLSAELETLPSPPYAGKQGRGQIAALSLAAPPGADPARRSVSVSVALSLDAATAAALNELFAKPQGRGGVFGAGEALGSLAVVGWGE